MVGRAERVYKRPESVLVVVHTPDLQVLLLERADVPGYWQSVTGGLKWGESPRDAALRELAEETGLTDPAVLYDLGESTIFPLLPPWRERYHPEVTENCEHHFLYQAPAALAPRLDGREHRAWAWLCRANAVRRVGSRTNRQLIERLGTLVQA